MAGLMKCSPVAKSLSLHPVVEGFELLFFFLAGDAATHRSHSGKCRRRTG